MRRTAYKAAITGGVYGAKALTLGDMDEFMDWAIDAGDGTKPQDLYAAVAWTFWCVNLRANNVSQIPYGVYSLTLPEGDEDEDNEEEWPIDLAPLLWDVEAWLSLKAAAYVFKRLGRRSQQLAKLQVLNANTMRVLKYDDDGPTVFRQKVGIKERDYSAEQIVYFRTFSPTTDIGPGIGAGAVGQVAAALIKNANMWAASFFENGAIPAVFLTTEGAVPLVEKERIQSRWEKILKGVGRAFKTTVLERGLVPTVIGQPVKDLAMPQLESTKREQILAAHNIPPGLAEAKTNRAERDALQYELWTQSLIPWVRTRIQPVLNDQLFNELGLRVLFKTNEIEAVQKAEIAKAESMAFTINGVALPAYQANVMSTDEVRSWIDSVGRAANLPPLDKTFKPEERVAPQPFGGPPPQEGPGTQQPTNERVDARTRPKALAPEWGHHRISLPS